jgi:S-layer protein
VTSGDGGLALGTTALGVNTLFTGGAGNDAFIAGATTKALTLGAGDNTVTISGGVTALATGGSITAGAGTADTLVFATTANAVTLSAAGTVQTAFKTAVTGFEKLSLAAAAGAVEVDVAGVLGATNGSNVTTVAVATNVLSLKNLVTSGAGATVTINAVNATNTGTGGVTLTGTAGAGQTDVLNLNLKNTAADGALVQGGVVTATNVETINVTVNDARVAGLAAPTQALNTLTLTDAQLAAVTVSGNQSLVLTHTAGTALTSLDASGMTLGGLTFTSQANQYATNVKGSLLGNDTLNFGAAIAAVTITEVAGANTITGSNTVASTLTGGSGVDTIKGGAGADVIVGGAGADVIYADNAGTKQVQIVTYATTNATANATFTVTIAGKAIVYTDAAGTDTVTAVAAGVRDLINADTSLNKLVVASAALGVLTVTDTVDGVITLTSATTSAATTATNGTIGVTGGTTTGTSGATANNVLTGGTGADSFIFGITSAAPSATVFNTINDFASASDIIDYSAAAMTIQAAATTAVGGTASITAAGVASFATADSTLALRLIATEAGIVAGGNTAGESAIFQLGADAYVFISNGVDGVGAGDQLIKLVGVDTTSATFDTITLANGNMTLA